MTLSAVLFAGGSSRRMGVDKATLDCGGRPLWQRQIALLRELQPADLWISARQRPVWCPPDIAVVFDVPDARGPVGGLAASCRKLKTSHLLALAVDLPRMSSDHLRKLWSLAGPGWGVVTRNGDWVEPLCAIYPAEAAAAVEEALTVSREPLQRLAERLVKENRLRVYVPDPAERSLYHNANSPADWQSIQP